MNFQMEYNSQKERMVIAEYGRNIQNLIEFAKAIENDEERQNFAEQVVNLMQQINPQSKNVADYRFKLWSHLFRIADYDINVKHPSGIQPKKGDDAIKPHKVDYPTKEKEFRHYGHHVRLLIEKAIGMEEGPIKEGLVENIASYMKLAYRTWNPEHYVSDEIILNDLKLLSKGKLEVSENSSIDTLTSAVRKRKKPTNPRDKGKNNFKSRRRR
jgi:hypothetical protein